MQSSVNAKIILLKECGIEKAADRAARTLSRGGIIIYPTETCYGIGADAFNEDAVKKVHDAKGQEYSKPISVIVASAVDATKIAYVGAKEKALIKRFMPGPLTLIAKKKKIVPDCLSKESIAFRISSNKVADSIAKKFGSPITATSANKHGDPEIYDSKEIIEKFLNKVDLIIDAGILPKKRPSTIYDCISGKIIREGDIKKEEIDKVLADK